MTVLELDPMDHNNYLLLIFSKLIMVVKSETKGVNLGFAINIYS